MFFSTSFLATITLAATALALPTTLLTKRVAANQQSCHVTNNVLFDSLSVDIGIPFNGGGGCGDVESAIQSYGVAVTNWKCNPDGDGNTQLNFDITDGMESSVDEALVSMYPTIVGGFNC